LDYQFSKRGEEIMPYNLISCSGWVAEGAGWVASSSCLKGRIGIVLLFFLIAIIRRWGGEEVGIEFNFLIALVLGLLSYLIVISLTGSFRWAFIFGLGLSLIGGYGAGMFIGGEE